MEFISNLLSLIWDNRAVIQVWLLSGAGIAFMIGAIKIVWSLLARKFGKNKNFKTFTLRTLNGTLSSIVILAGYYLQLIDLGSPVANLALPPALATTATLIYRFNKVLTNPLYLKICELIENQKIATEVKESEHSALLNSNVPTKTDGFDL